MLHVDYDRWGQTPEDLRQLATSAAHQRTRERFLALYEVAQASCATEVAARSHRHPQTVMEWLHLYNTRGPEALIFRRTGGRRLVLSKEKLARARASLAKGLTIRETATRLGVGKSALHKALQAASEHEATAPASTRPEADRQCRAMGRRSRPD
jgi:transposase